MNRDEGKMRVSGYIGKPLISRGNRNYENYYINGRYVKSNIIAKAIEDAYKDFTMQHKYPFTVLHFWLDGNDIDVNVHPTKMELRFSHRQEVYDFVYRAVKETLIEPELIPRVEISKPAEEKNVPEKKVPEVHDEAYFMKKMRERVQSYHRQASQAEVKDTTELHRGNLQIDRIKEGELPTIKIGNRKRTVCTARNATGTTRYVAGNEGRAVKLLKKNCLQKKPFRSIN